MIFTAFALTGLIITLIITGVAVIRDKKGLGGSGGIITTVGRFIDSYYLVFFLLIFAVFLITRIFRIEALPTGIHVDELSMATDAKSILYHGTDRGGIRYPAYFQNYGGGQNALYIYIQAFILNFLDPTIFAFRIQAVFWGAICLFMMFGIAYELTESRGWALSGPILVTTLPVFFMSERWGLEAYLFLPFSAIVMYLAIRSVKSGKCLDWLLTGIFLGASLYTYAVSYIVWPVFLLLSLFYLIYLKKINLKQAVVFTLPVIILAIPLILFQLVNFEIIPPFSLGPSDFFPLPEARQRELGLKYTWDSIKFIGKLLLGGEHLTYNSVSEFGTIYLFLIPFMVAGLIVCIKKTVESIKMKRFTCHALILFFWIGSTIFMLLVKDPSVNRLNMIFMPLTLFIVAGVYALLSRNAAAVTWVVFWTGASFAFFLYFYFFMMTGIYGRHELFTDSSFGRAIERSEKYYMKDEYTHIYVQFENAVTGANQQAYYFAGTPDEVYSDDISTYGRVTAKLPEEIDLNEDAVYIIGDEWPHITSYLISEGFFADQSIPGCSILFKLGQQ